MKKIIMLSGMNYSNEDTLSCTFSEELQDVFKRILKDTSKITFIASDPSNFAKTDTFVDKILHAFHNCNIHFLTVKKIDNRTAKNDLTLDKNQVIFLCGGHTSEQMKFFKCKKLCKKIKKYNGIIIGLSAGSINMSRKVFVTPDDYNNHVAEFYDGLNLVNFTMHPHLDISDKIQISIFKELAKEYHFFALPNASFILIENKTATVIGDCYEFFSGDYKEWKIKHIINNK